MSDGSPPNSWYDPPEPRFDYEINSEADPKPGKRCDKCDEVAYRVVEVRDMGRRYNWEITVCKNHYETIIEDEIQAAEDYEPDYDED